MFNYTYQRLNIANFFGETSDQIKEKGSIPGEITSLLGRGNMSTLTEVRGPLSGTRDVSCWPRLQLLIFKNRINSNNLCANTYVTETQHVEDFIKIANVNIA